MCDVDTGQLSRAVLPSLIGPITKVMGAYINGLLNSWPCPHPVLSRQISELSDLYD